MSEMNGMNTFNEMDHQADQNTGFSSPEISPRRPAKPWQGIVFFAAVIAMMIFIAAPVQYFFGMPGLALTELFLLIMAVAATFIFGQDLRQVFPVHRPQVKPIFATILTWIGCLLLLMVVSLLLMYFFPEGYLETSSGLSEVLSSTALPITFFIVAIMPAICEEAVCRGFLQYSFQSVKSQAAIVICMGIFFGIFHLDPYRFLPMTILGMGIAYVMRKTQNMLYPCLFHFINNAFSVLLSSGGNVETSTDIFTGPMILLSLGVYLMFAAASPFCLLGAHCLLRKPATQKKSLLVPVLVTSFLAGLMIVIGFCLMIFALTDPEFLTMTE